MFTFFCVIAGLVGMFASLCLAAVLLAPSLEVQRVDTEYL